MRKFAKIERVSESGAEYSRGTPAPKYLDDVVTAQQSGKTIVEVQRDRQKAISSYIVNLQNILNNKPAYASVDEAVRDMRERTGLNTYLTRIAQRNADGTLSEASTKKVLAMINEGSLPEVLKKDKYKDIVKDIIEYLKQKIDNRHGHINAYSLQEEISKLYKLDLEDSLSPEIKEYIESLIKDYEDRNGSDKIEASPVDLARAGEDMQVDEGDKNFFSNMEG
jgi:hypothetical protein